MIKSSPGSKTAPATKGKRSKTDGSRALQYSSGSRFRNRRLDPGALAADLFDIKFKPALFAIVLGVLMASVIVTVICYGFPSLAASIF